MDLGIELAERQQEVACEERGASQPEKASRRPLSHEQIGDRATPTLPRHIECRALLVAIAHPRCGGGIDRGAVSEQALYNLASVPDGGDHQRRRAILAERHIRVGSSSQQELGDIVVATIARQAKRRVACGMA